MIPIHVGIMSHFRSIVEKYIPLKTVTIRPNDKPWMDSKVRLAIRSGTVCFEFIIYVRLQLLGKAAGLNVTL